MVTEMMQAVVSEVEQLEQLSVAPSSGAEDAAVQGNAAMGGAQPGPAALKFHLSTSAAQVLAGHLHRIATDAIPIDNKPNPIPQWSKCQYPRRIGHYLHSGPARASRGHLELLIRHCLQRLPPPLQSTRAVRRHTRVSVKQQRSSEATPIVRVKRRPMQGESIQDWAEHVGRMNDGAPRLGFPGAKIWGNAPGGGVVKESDIRRLELGFWAPAVFDSWLEWWLFHHPQAPAGVWIAPTGTVTRCYRGKGVLASTVKLRGPQVLKPGAATDLWFPVWDNTGTWSVIRVNITEEVVDVLGQPPAGEVERTLQWVSSWLDRGVDGDDNPLDAWPRVYELSECEGWTSAGSVAWSLADWVTAQYDTEPPQALTMGAQSAMMQSCRIPNSDFRDTLCRILAD